MRLEPFIDRLQELLPSSWRVEILELESPRSRRADAVIRVVAPDGSAADLLVELKPRLSGSQARDVGARLTSLLDATEAAGAVVFTRFASRMARDRLRQAGVSYLDLTGNVWVRLERPAVFVERTGADKDPNPPRRGVRSLKGPKAGRIVRGLCDWRPPVGVRELARRTATDPGYVARVLALLEDDDVVVRDGRGGVVDVRWDDALRRWSRDYSVARTNRAVSYLAPRGLPWLRDALRRYTGEYALTGSAAVPPEAQVSTAPLLSCYVATPEKAAEDLDLRETASGANVLLLEPFDPVVFRRTRQVDGLTVVALTQCAVDLMTGSGREPSQAAALLTWMGQNEHAWRA